MEPLSWLEIFAAMAGRFLPVWVALVVTFVLSITFKRRLGLYGKLFDSPVGMVGFGIVMFWVFTAIFADLIITHDPELARKCDRVIVMQDGHVVERVG